MDKIEYSILIKQLNEAADAYYNSETPILSDEEYDYKLEQIKKFEQQLGYAFSNSPTQKVGASVLSILNKILITPKPMLSLEKCHSDEEVAAFAGKHTMIAMVKLDGLSVRIKYNNGKLMSANTRGNGVEGTDITEHIKQFQNVPLEIPYKKELIIDGEAIIKMPDFKEINKNNEFKNPRNAAAGALNVLDTKLVKERKLSFILWDIISIEPDEKLEYFYGSFRYMNARFAIAEKFGFEIVPNALEDIYKSFPMIKKINQLMMNYNTTYPCDGVVWKFNDIEYGESLGATGHHFKNAIAWKPEVEIVESKLKYINWTMGRTGTLTPVAVFDPVELDGTIVERASLHNYSIMRKILGSCAYVGEPLKIFKANMIIPQILEAGPHYNYGYVIAHGGVSAHDVIETCPICGGEVWLVESDDGVENYVCQNPNCEGKLINRLDHFCGKKGLDIKGLSKATLEKLIAWEWVSCFADIYELSQYKIIWMDTPGFGDRSVKAILTAIENSKTQTLESFISAIGIPLIGRSMAKEICKHVSTYEEFRKLVNEKFNFSQWNSFGPEKCASILNYDYTDADKVVQYLTFSSPEETTNDLNGLTIVITGSLKEYKNRNLLKNEIEKRGGKVAGSVSSNTSYLINNDINSKSSKNDMAKKLNIPIISEKDFIEKFLL